MSLDTELLEALRQAHGYWLDSLGARIATIEHVVIRLGLADDHQFMAKLEAARQARADAERTCVDVQTYYAEQIT